MLSIIEDKTLPKANKANDAFLIELKLSVNERLYEKKLITKELYIKAKEAIIKDMEIKKVC